MIQKEIIHENHRRLLLFFAGWAADETPFRHYRPVDSDFTVCYDYRNLTFDTSRLLGYEEVNIVGWSMGVWAATAIDTLATLPLNRCVALNGSVFPCDDTRGIPRAIYYGTLAGLSGPSLHKFLRRMCADSKAFRAFLEITPRRELEEIGEELAGIPLIIDTRQREGKSPGAVWKEAVVGRNDRIIPPDNQANAWKELGVPFTMTDDAHYEEPLFRHYLQDAWTNS